LFTGEHFHVAGNDAQFILRLLFMIAMCDVRRELKELTPWVPLFESIARGPITPYAFTKGSTEEKSKSSSFE
jgi:hypothetical protein